MNWSNNLPKKDGWYWIRSEGEKPVVVRVMCKWVHSVLSMEPVHIKEYKDPVIEWYGPIEEPCENKPIKPKHRTVFNYYYLEKHYNYFLKNKDN